MDFLRQSTPPVPFPVVPLLVAIYLLSGIIGHDPWKTEDAVHLGIAFSFASHGHILFPYIAGEAWPHTAPFYHWVAALLGKLLGGLLPFHDAARLATPLFGGIFLFALARTARLLHDLPAGRLAPLLAIGTLGLLQPMHDAQPAVAGLACAAVAWWGAALVMQGRTVGALLTGGGIGLAFLSHGLAGLVMALPALGAALIRRNYRALLLALLLTLPLVAAWPLALHLRAPQLWTSWWHNEWAEATLARSLPEVAHLTQPAWALWPILPLACWTLWLHRHRLATHHLALPGLALGLLWYLSGSPRTLALLPLIIPCTLLAAAGADKLRRGAANAFDWFGVMTFSFFAVMLWLGASAQALDWPPRIARNFDKLAPGHETLYSVMALAFAAVLTALWLFALRQARTAWRPTVRWAGGAVLLWSLTATLWFAWIDHAKSYRAVSLELAQALPPQIDCLERHNVGTPVRASLDYFSNIRTTAPSQKRGCGWRLTIDDRERVTPAGWQPVWQGGRPSDRKEKWFLERRITDSPSR